MPAEGLLGRIVADALIHYFNVVGAYLICVAMIAVALYLSTAFSFGAVQIWSQTRFSFAYAALDRFADWRAERERKKAAKELEKKRATANAKPVVTAQLVPRRGDSAAAEPDELDPRRSGPPIRLPRRRNTGRPVKSGIERMFDAELENHDIAEPGSRSRRGANCPRRDRSISRRKLRSQDRSPSPRAPTARCTARPRCRSSRAATSCPRRRCCAGPTSTAPSTKKNSKTTAQVLQEKYGEFDVRGQVTQINPGPVVTTFEFKPEAGIKYSRITGLTDDLCLALRAESILIERMAGKVDRRHPGAEPRARNHLAARSGGVAGVPGHQVEAHAGDGQGHQRPHRDRRPEQHAAPADCRLDRIGQERGHQRVHHVDPVQGDAGRSAADPGRSEAAGTGQLRRRAAPAHADHHRAEAGVECAAQRGARDGAAAEGAGRKGRPQHRPVQQALRQQHVQACSKTAARPNRCRTSSSSSTSWPT